VNAHDVDDCLSSGKDSVQLSTEAGAESNLANDYGDLTTYSCTLAEEGIPWWAVDLGADYYVSEVILTLPALDGEFCNYHQSCSMY